MTVVTAFAAVSTFLAVLQIVMLWSGALGVTVDHGSALLVLGTAAAAGLLMAARFATGLWRVDRPDDGPLWHRLLHVGLGLAGLVALGWCVHVWRDLWELAGQRAVIDWDGLYYHIPAMNGWAVAGRVCWLPDLADVPFANGYPMAVESTTWLMHYVLGDSNRLDACNLWYWPLGVTSLAVVARFLGARNTWPWLAGGLLAGVPAVVCQSVTCYIDPAYACTVMGAVASACLLVFHDGRLLVWRAALCGLNLGLMAGAKGVGAPFLVIVVLVIIGGIAAREGFADWRLWLGRLALAAVCVLAVAGYWYGRNVVETGNPVHPIQVVLGDKVLFEGFDPKLMMADNVPPWLADVPAHFRMFVAWTQPDAPVSGYEPFTGLGKVWLLGGIPAVLLLWLHVSRGEREEERKRLLFLTVLVLMLLAFQPGRWWGRMTVWLHVLGLPALAAVASLAADRLRRNILTAPVIVAVGFVSLLAMKEANVTRGIEWRTGRVVGQTTSDASIPFRTTRQYHFPGLIGHEAGEAVWASGKIARSGWSRVGTLLGGTLAQPLGARELRLLPDEPTTADVEALRADGFAWVLWDVLAAGEPPAVLVETAVETSRFHPAADFDLRLLRIF